MYLGKPTMLAGHSRITGEHPACTEQAFRNSSKVHIPLNLLTALA